jgi:ABC-type sugar transport system ATPase subunit
MIAGLEEISGGEIRIDGERVNEQRGRPRLAMVFQTYALYPHMTVKQNMAFGLENIKMPKARSPGA